MYYKSNGKWVKATKKSLGAVTPSELRRKRDAFERKKLTKAFRVWRYKQYKQVQGGKCYYCRKPIVGAWYTDHKIPLFRGGTSAYSNLCVTCRPCNDKKSWRLPT